MTEELIKTKIGNKKVDVLFGGIVCKGFSLAGVRNPFDPRNYLYKHQLRLVNILKPKVSVIENVTAIKNMILKYFRNNLFLQFKKLKYFSFYYSVVPRLHFEQFSKLVRDMR
jgi:site-specific DNA-cytosine methylase